MLNPEQQKIFASLTCNTRVRVRFAEVTDPVWIVTTDDDDKVEIFNDFSDCVYSAMMVDIIRGNTSEWVVDEVNDDHLTLRHATRTGSHDEPETCHVTPAHLRELEVLEPGDRWNRRETTIPGLEYTFVQCEDGILEVGRQKIPRAGQEQIVTLLAERLDLEVVPTGFSDDAAKTSSALAALVSHLHCLPTGLGDFLGDDLYEQVMRALGRDDVLDEREDVEDEA